MRETESRGGLKNNSSNASMVPLDDEVTTSGLAGQIEQRGSEARLGSTGCEACAGQIKINKSNQISLSTVYHIVQQYTQLKSHLHPILFFNIIMGHASNDLCSILTFRHSQILVCNLGDFNIHNNLAMIFGGSLGKNLVNHQNFFFFQHLKEQ
jgi:hypothetical protein